MRRGVAAAVIVAAAGYYAWTLAHVLSLSPRDRVGFIPDDSFYYLTLARNFATQGQWSFDSGVSRTNGFHLLHAYVLAAVFSNTRGRIGSAHTSIAIRLDT
jgi:hypothetical protein